MAVINISNIISAIRSDAMDTTQKTNEVSQVLSALRVCEGMSVADAKDFLSDVTGEKATIMIDDKPFTIDFSDAKDSLTDTFNVTISQLTAEGSLLGTLMSADESGNIIVNYDSLVTVHAQDYNFNDIINQTAEALVNSDLITASLDAVKTTSPISYFDSVLAKYNGQLGGTTPQLVSVIKGALSQSDATGCLALALGNIYTNINQGHVESDNSISFPDKRYYVQGFSGEIVLDTVYSLASGLFSALTAAISPVLYAVSFVGTQLVKGVKNMISSLSDTQFSYQADAIDDLYAQAICSRTLSRSEIPAAILSYLDKYGCLKISMSSQVVNIVPSGNKFILLIIPRLNFNPGTHLYPDAGGARYNDTIYAAGFSINKGHQQLTYSSLTFGANINDMSLRQFLVGCLMAITNNLNVSFGYSSTSDCIPDFSVHMDATELTKFFGACWIGREYGQSATTAYLSLISWANIVNYVIPSLQALFSDSNNSIYWDAIQTAVTDGLNYNINNDYFVSADYVDGRSIRIIPPAYSITAMLAVIAGIALTTAVCGAVVATSFAVRRKIRNVMHKKQVDIEAAKYRYEASGSQEDWDSYFTQIKSYNRIASVTGLSRISLYNGQELSSGANGSYTSNPIGFSELKKLITGV